MNLKDSEVHPVLDDVYDLRLNPSFLWAPDGQKLAFSTVHSYTLPINLNSLPRNFQIVDTNSGKVQALLPDDRVRVDFSWSHDSNKLVYLSDPVEISSFQTIYSTLYIMDIQTQEETLIAEFAAIGSPIWSPVDDMIAFTASTEEELYSIGQFNVYLIKSDGTDLQRLTNDGFFNVGSWSPDGSKLALEYVGEQLTDDEIYILDIDSGDLEQITDNNVLDAHPIWVELE